MAGTLFAGIAAEAAARTDAGVWALVAIMSLLFAGLLRPRRPATGRGRVPPGRGWRGRRWTTRTTPGD